MKSELSQRQQDLLRDPEMLHLTGLDPLVPPMLEKAFGYDPEHLVAIPIPEKLRVPLRFVAFYYWGGKFTYADGMLLGTGEWYSWQIFLYHPCIMPWLFRFQFGADDGPPDHYLFLDREERSIYVAPVSLAQQFLRAQRWSFLRTQNPDLSELEEDEPPSPPVEMTSEELNQIMEQWIIKQGAATPRQFALHPQRELEAALQSWLDQARSTNHSECQS